MAKNRHIGKKYDPIGGYNVYQENMTREGSDTPEGFEGVIFSESRPQKEKLVSPAPPQMKVKDRIKQLTPEAVLSTLAELAGVGEDLLVSKCRGRIGNPMKLVAAHLLVYQCGLKAGEAGYILKMTPSDISKALKKVRERKNESDEIGKLIKAFEEEKSKKGKRKGLTP